MAFGPEAEADPVRLRDPAGTERFRNAALDCAAPRLRSSQEMNLLIGFGVLHMLRILEICLDDPDETPPVENWPPHRALSALARGTGDFAPIFARFN